jgi:hypothetical protein
MSGVRGGLIPEFTQADIDRKIEKFRQEKIRKCLETLSWIGIQCVDFARKNHGYTDRTGNLTGSLGYAVVFNGDIKKQDLEGSHEGQAQAVKVIAELANQFSQGMILIVLAGMEYAAAVESKGYDVITGSSFEGEKLLKFMKEKLGAIIL